MRINVCSPSHRDYAALRRVSCIDEKKLLSSSGITSLALGDPFGSKCLLPVPQGLRRFAACSLY